MTTGDDHTPDGEPADDPARWHPDRSAETPAAETSTAATITAPADSGDTGGRRRRDLWLLGASIVVLLGLLVAVALNRTGSSDEPAPSAASGSSAAPAAPREFGPLGDLSTRRPGDPRALGRVDAPVTMVLFSDFRCPYCAEFSRTIQPALMRDYVDTGKLRIEWRDQPIFGAQSEYAARAGWAAAAQGRFWEFVDEIYRSTPATGHPDLPIDVLVAHAKAAGVPDLERFRREAQGSTFDDAVVEDIRPALKYGIIGVPTVVIDGDPITGIREIATYGRVIDGHLAAR